MFRMVPSALDRCRGSDSNLGDGDDTLSSGPVAIVVVAFSGVAFCVCSLALMQ